MSGTMKQIAVAAATTLAVMYVVHRFAPATVKAYFT